MSIVLELVKCYITNCIYFLGASTIGEMIVLKKKMCPD